MYHVRAVYMLLSWIENEMGAKTSNEFEREVSECSVVIFAAAATAAAREKVIRLIDMIFLT